MINRKRIIGCLLSALSGLLIVFSFPTANLFFLAWFALIPLLLVIDEENMMNSLFYGFIAGFISSIGTLYWIFSMVQFNTESLIQSGTVLVLLAIYLSKKASKTKS